MLEVKIEDYKFVILSISHFSVFKKILNRHGISEKMLQTKNVERYKMKVSVKNSGNSL